MVSDSVLSAHRALMERVIECRACPRLVEHRERAGVEKVRRYRDWDYWARPVPAFGSPDAELCIVGLAPAANGGNRTGRMFTGDPSADFLATALHAGGFASQPTSQHRDDGLTLINACITSAVKCAPPANQPTAEEQARCLPYLIEELRLMPNLKAVLGLGKLGFDAYLRAAGPWGSHSRAGSRSATASGTTWARLPDALRLLPPKPAQHLHGPPDARGVGGGAAGDPGVPARRIGPSLHLSGFPLFRLTLRRAQGERVGGGGGFPFLVLSGPFPPTGIFRLRPPLAGLNRFWIRINESVAGGPGFSYGFSFPARARDEWAEPIRTCSAARLSPCR